MLHTLTGLPHALDNPRNPYISPDRPRSRTCLHTVPLARTTCARGVLAHGRPRSSAPRMHAGNMARCEGGHRHPVCACSLSLHVVGACSERCHEAERSLHHNPQRFHIVIGSALAYITVFMPCAGIQLRCVRLHTAVLSRSRTLPQGSEPALAMRSPGSTQRARSPEARIRCSRTLAAAP